MSSKKPSETNRIGNIARSFKGKISSLLNLSQAPTPSSTRIEMNSSSDNPTSISPVNVVPVAADHALTKEFATEAHTLSSDPPILAPVPKQLGSASGRGLETLPTDMSLATRGQLSRESGECLSIQDSGLGFSVNAPNALITDGTSVDMSLATHSPLSPLLPDVITQVSTESEHNISIQDLGLGLSANAQNIPVQVAGGTFVNNILPANARERHDVLQKLNSSSLFVGRKDVLNKLQTIFIHCADSKLMSVRSSLLWGTGGIGKTQICLKFIEEMSGRLSHVFWVDASSVESITMSLRGISSISAAQASCLDDLVGSVLQWMSGIQGEWLIVFDNADNAPVDVVERFIAPGNGGNVLITSRNQSMGRVISSENIIEINEMEEADAITLLLKASCLNASAEHIDVAKDIITQIGCMPLAVDEAGAYIESGRCSVHEYLQQISRGASNYDRTVYQTWDYFKEIKMRASGQSSGGDAQAAHAAVLILQICAFYHHSNISKDIFRSAAEESRGYMVDSEVAKKLPLAMSSLDRTLLALDDNGHWDEFVFGQGIAVLLSFSLMERDESSEMMSVHPLVHRWSREQISKSEQQRMYEMGSIILCCAIPQGFSGYDFRLRRLIYPHIKANELYGSQMGLTKKYYDDKWSNFIFVMREVGDWKHLEQLGVQVLDMRKKLLNAEHPETLRSMADIARTYSVQGRWNEAEQLEVQVLDMRKKVLGAEHPDTLISMADLARTYVSKGDLKEAEQLNVQVLDLRKKLFGAGHPDTLRSMGNLARTYFIQGKWNEAEQLEIQVLDMSKKLLGAEHPDTLGSMANLASTYSIQGKWNEAEQLEVQALDMNKKLLGAEHPNTLRCMANLAKTYANKGNLMEAEQLEVQVLDLEMKLLGPGHPETLISMENLARTYASKGDLNKAEQLEVQVLDMTKKMLGAEHPQTLTSMANLAGTYSSQGKWKEAEQLNAQVLDTRKKELHSEHLLSE